MITTGIQHTVQRTTSNVQRTEILIKLLESVLYTRMSSKLRSHKMADTSKDELLLGGGIRHLTATSQYHAHKSSCLRESYCLNALILGNISSACAKEYLIAAMR